MKIVMMNVMRRTVLLNLRMKVISYSCQSIGQLKDNEKDNDEKGRTVKLRDSQNGDKSTNSLMDDSFAKNHLSQR